jgi:hypothetical protein
MTFVLENKEGSAKKLFSEYPPRVFNELPGVLDPGVDDEDLDDDDDDEPVELFDESDKFFNKFAKQLVGQPQLELPELLPLFDPDPFVELAASPVDFVFSFRFDPSILLSPPFFKFNEL